METSKYTFIKKRYDSEEILAIGKERIKDLALADVRDQYGQITGSDNAGDSVTLDTEKAVRIANKLSAELEFEGKFSLTDYVSAYDNSQLFDAIKADDKLEEGADYTLNQEMVRGFEYWDGHNWRTVVVQADHYDPEYELIEDENLINELNQAIEDREFEKEGQGVRIYSGGNYQIVDSQWHGSFAAWELTHVDNLMYEGEN